MNENGQNLVGVSARKGLYLPMRGMITSSDHCSSSKSKHERILGIQREWEKRKF